MPHRAQFGEYYSQVVERLYHAFEWRYDEIKAKPGHARESEILAKLLDMLLADQVGHDLDLHRLEGALHSFQKVRHDSFTPNKYKDINHLLGLEEKTTVGYTPHLYGNVTLEVHGSA